MKHASFDYRQIIRLKAADMFIDSSLSSAEIGRRLGVSRKTISLWRKDWNSSGVAGLTIGKPGRYPRLSQSQCDDLVQTLLQGPAAHGYETQLWTLKRIADLIEKQTGIKYHPSHVWKILTRLNWTCQRPERLAKERDEQAIARWKSEDWPCIKRGQ